MSFHEKLYLFVRQIINLNWLFTTIIMFEKYGSYSKTAMQACNGAEDGLGGGAALLSILS